VQVKPSSLSPFSWAGHSHPSHPNRNSTVDHFDGTYSVCCPSLLRSDELPGSCRSNLTVLLSFTQYFAYQVFATSEFPVLLHRCGLTPASVAMSVIGGWPYKATLAAYLRRGGLVRPNCVAEAPSFMVDFIISRALTIALDGGEMWRQLPNRKSPVSRLVEVATRP
jgi:hypothetical protein